MKKIMAVVGVVLGLMAGGANAALFSRAGGTMVYDNVLNITWLADWNYAATSGYATANATVTTTGTNAVNRTGTMGWNAANTWASTLLYGGFDDWRLPSALNRDGSGPCTGYSCNSEMGYMFYVNWGATSGNSYSTGTNTANLALFINVQVPNKAYWFGTPLEVSGTRGRTFNPTSGFQSSPTSLLGPYMAVAVRSGDVAPSAVPEPGTVALLSLGLGLVGIGAARRRQA